VPLPPDRPRAGMSQPDRAGVGGLRRRGRAALPRLAWLRVCCIRGRVELEALARKVAGGTVRLARTRRGEPNLIGALAPTDNNERQRASNAPPIHGRALVVARNQMTKCHVRAAKAARAMPKMIQTVTLTRNFIGHFLAMVAIFIICL